MRFDLCVMALRSVEVHQSYPIDYGWGDLVGYVLTLVFPMHPPPSHSLRSSGHAMGRVVFHDEAERLQERQTRK